VSTWDDLKEKATEVADTVSEKFSDLATTANTEYSILRHKRAISLYEDEIHEVEQAMGKRVYELHELEKIEDRELISRCGEVDAIKKRIEEAEDEIEHLQEVEAKEKSGNGSDSAKAEEAENTGDSNVAEGNDNEKDKDKEFKVKEQ